MARRTSDRVFNWLTAITIGLLVFAAFAQVMALITGQAH